ncbi:glutamyl-tRNA reductase [Actinobacteria bacterium YIM 96077]|uniref:Glutamyl-tRNA reductase n=1 Tax=Phytoactinopolyspora halophila TaxID=1981511 RepID=A0A329QL69_9ACTN|nr:glutamyl-tRNA reductase [Phytoactinopolyspora halophila]AYY14810.1 glutamyl-tRNA reductase [Actinobacteria bacterium YIM 96077]RAW13084.1 glutamyl-tRNA reductase [Phytoactinopolyspora halophila]
MSVLVVGLSHRSAPVDALEDVALDGEAVTKILDDVHGAAHLSEAVIVATCNRLELYADAATFHGGIDEAGALLSRHTGVPLERLTPYFYVHYEERAVSHLFHVASGLDSMVVGETQILGQVREAFRLAQTSGVTGRVLTELFQTALRVGKRAHAETDIGTAGRSLVTVGLASIVPSIARSESQPVASSGTSWRELVSGLRALVVGAGSMSALAATTLAEAGAEVVIANRTLDHGSRIASSVGGHAVPMSEVADHVGEVDLLVSCTGAAGVIIPYDLVEAAMEYRRGRPLGILDLALPHDVDASVSDVPGVVLTDLSRLAQKQDADGGAVADDVEAVRAIVVEEVSGFTTARRAARVAPTVVALREMADEVVEAELARIEGRLPDLDDHARNEVRATVRRVVDKLLHSPTVRVKELASQPDGASYESALRELFALDPRSVEAVAKPDTTTESAKRGENS